MGQCALVSVNGGWNLLIGADPASTGAWSPVQVPAACREVWDEARKDACFGQAAREFIAAHPLAWAELVPKKLAATFDYCGAAGWYLNTSNAAVFDDGRKIALGALETVLTRAVLLLALVAVFRMGAREAMRSPMRWIRRGVAALGVLSVFTLHAWIGYLALVVLGVLDVRAITRRPVLVSSALAVLAATMATHAVFFGSGRYSLVTLPLLCGLVAFLDGPRPAKNVEDPTSPANLRSTSRTTREASGIPQEL
jgi:hypothetical protein